MSVRRIRSSWWVDFRFGGARHRKRSPDNSRQGALVYEATLRQRLAKGEPVDGPAPPGPTSSPPFDEFAKEWLATYVVPNLKPGSIKSWTHILRSHLLPWFGNRPVASIGSEDVARYQAAKTGVGLLPQTVNKHLVALRRMLQIAVDWGRLDHMPKIKLLRETLPSFVFLSPEECARLLEDWTSYRCREMVLVALRTGMRIGEILALDWSDVDFDRALVTVRRNVSDGVLCSPKNNKERHIPLAQDLLATLSLRRRDDGLVFCTRAGALMNQRVATRMLLALCRRTRVRRIGWHVLRHTFASHLVTAGVPMPAVQQLLGHADLRMTLRYSHLAPSSLRQAISVFDRTPNSGQLAVNAAGVPSDASASEHEESPVFIGRSSAQPYPATQVSA